MTWGNVLAGLGQMRLQPEAVAARAARLEHVAGQAGDSASRVGNAPNSDLSGAMFSLALADACVAFSHSGAILSHRAQTTAEDIVNYVGIVSQQDSAAAQSLSKGIRR